MAKDLYQNTQKNENTDSGVRRRRKQKRGNRIIGIAALGVLLVACGAPSGRVEETQRAETKEEPKGWPEEHGRCEMQELGGYLYGHTSVSPYASAEITVTDYEGVRLETDWNAPSAFQFAGEADVTWRFYNSLGEMETALNKAAVEEMDEGSLHFLYYTFPMTENGYALDLYHILKRKFDTKEHPLTAWSTDNGKLFCYMQETVKEVDGYEFSCLDSRDSRVNLYMKDRMAYGLTLLNRPTEDDDETLEYVFMDVFQHYGVLGSGWGLDEESLYWADHDERLTELENPKRSFLEVRGIDENWESAGDEGIMRYFGLLVEADYQLPLTEDGRMLSLHFSLAKEEGEEEVSLASFSDFIDDYRKDSIISASRSLAESEDGAFVDEKETFAVEEDTEFRYYLLNGFCMDEPYEMTVTDMETGEVLQECRVSLSIELPDFMTRSIGLIDLASLPILGYTTVKKLKNKP